MGLLCLLASCNTLSSTKKSKQKSIGEYAYTGKEKIVYFSKEETGFFGPWASVLFGRLRRELHDGKSFFLYSPNAYYLRKQHDLKDGDVLFTGSDWLKIPKGTEIRHYSWKVVFIEESFIKLDRSRYIGGGGNKYRTYKYKGHFIFKPKSISELDKELPRVIKSR